MKKFFALALSVFAFALLLAGCAKEPSAEEAPKSKLIGTFTYSESVRTNEIEDSNGARRELRIYPTAELAAGGNLYCTAYPFNLLPEGGNKVTYAIDQRLKLKRDFTYSYQYTVTLTNSEDWGNDFARISVVMEGSFVYDDGGNGNYTVRLEDPVAGNFTVYGATVSNETIYGWTINSSATYIEDVATELAINEDYGYNRYLAGRNLTVNKEEKSLRDNIFYADIMNDIAPYCDYTI